MCRLYAFRSTEQTKVECTLVHAQNALIAQSKQDLAGCSHTHGRGLSTFEDHHPVIERQAWAAYHGEHFARAASRIYSKLVTAHVRRATVGGAALENTHPFFHGKWSFVHNGTVPSFDKIRLRILESISPVHRDAIKGATDSEHIFRYILTLVDIDPAAPLIDIVRKTVFDVSKWSSDTNPKGRMGLNIVLSDGEQLIGSRPGRTLYSLTRTGVYDCEICGFPHIHHDPNRDHRAAVVASEPITHEDWIEIPNRSIWQLGSDARMKIEPLQ